MFNPTEQVVTLRQTDYKRMFSCYMNVPVTDLTFHCEEGSAPSHHFKSAPSMYKNKLGFSAVDVKLPRRRYQPSPFETLNPVNMLVTNKLETDEQGQKWMDEEIQTYFIQNGAHGQKPLVMELMGRLQTTGDIGLICAD